MKYILFFSFLILTSCATENSYRFLFGGRGEVYTENEQQPLHKSLQDNIGGTVTTTSGDPNQIKTTAFGGQIGIIEETPFGITTTLSVFANSYAPVKYEFNSSSYGAISESLAIAGTGLDATIGYSFGPKSFKIRPGLSYKIESQTITPTVTGSGLPSSVNQPYKQTIAVYGGGIAFEFPFVFENSSIILQGDYRVPSKTIPGVTSLSYSSVQANLVFGKSK